ncbi:MAG: branched-chain amino acid ABC transporter permease [Clostridia bacterium]|nr:branched-chain amino acid ABC transporter permease [Clostridia bacterium]
MRKCEVTGVKKLTLSATAKDRYTTYGLVVLIAVAVQLFVSYGNASNSFKGLLVPTCVYVLAALSLNLVVGVSGELSLGQAGFMCIGAYVGATFSVITAESIASDAVRFTIAILLGGIVAGVFGFLIGIPVLRLRGDYLAIVTLAFGEIIKSVCGNLYLSADKNGLFVALDVKAKSAHAFDAATKVDYVNGALGINGIPRTSNIRVNEWAFVICMAVILIAVIVMLNFIDSKQGRAVMAARDNRIAAEAMGVNVTRSKMTAFVMSAFFAGVAGVLYAHNYNVLDTSNFDYNQSILILVFVVLGGMTKMRSVMISTIILYVLPEALRGLNKWRMLIYAIVLIAMMLINNSVAIKKLVEKIQAKFAKGAENKEGGAA